MSKKLLSPQYISEFCAELALLVRAGVTVGDGIATLSQDYSRSDRFLISMREATESGDNLYNALIKTGQAPDYMTDMIRLGERAGRLEQTLLSLAEYYDSRARLAIAVRNALIYPLVLIVMLAAVVIVLITKVLPIFSDVFTQMGAQLPAFSLFLIRVGQGLSSASAVLIWVLAGIVFIGLVVFLIPPLRQRVSAFVRYHFGASGIFRETVTAQFAAAMTTAISSGLDTEEAVLLAGKVIHGIKKTDAGVEECQRMLQEGESVEKSLAASGVFTSRDIRLLALGVRTGTSDSVMSDIARRSNERALDSIDSALSKIEPTLVIIISVVVSAVLLSVMLPLTGIMSSIG